MEVEQQQQLTTPSNLQLNLPELKRKTEAGPLPEVEPEKKPKLSTELSAEEKTVSETISENNEPNTPITAEDIRKLKELLRQEEAKLLLIKR